LMIRTRLTGFFMEWARRRETGLLRETAGERKERQ